MPVRIAEKAGNAYHYPLLIRHLLHTPLATAPDQEIVYRDFRPCPIACGHVIDAWLAVVASRNPACREMREEWF